MGAHTFINKRQGNDIWKNLFELPLIETSHAITDEELLSSPEFIAFFESGESPQVRCLVRQKKHVLSHRIIYANFYEVILPEESNSFSSFLKVRVDQLEQYAISRLIHLFFEKYL